MDVKKNASKSFKGFGAVHLNLLYAMSGKTMVLTRNFTKRSEKNFCHGFWIFFLILRERFQDIFGNPMTKFSKLTAEAYARKNVQLDNSLRHCVGVEK